MHVCLTIDMEPDCWQARESYRGVTEGTPPLLTLLGEERLKATFFVSADVARKFPNVVRQIADFGHEVGCLSDGHRLLDQLPEAEARAEIHVATALLRRFYRVVSFRAAEMRMLEKYLSLLESEGYLIDASLAKFRANYWLGPRSRSKLLRASLSTPERTLSLSWPLRSIALRTLASPVVLAVRPWDFIDAAQHHSHPTLANLRSVIEHFKRRDAEFCRLEDLLPASQPRADVPARATVAQSVA